MSIRAGSPATNPPPKNWRVEAQVSDGAPGDARGPYPVNAKPGQAALPDRAVTEALNELQSPVDFVRWGASRFCEFGLVFGHGSDNAVDEALGLVLHALHLEPGVPEEVLHARLTRAEKAAVVDLLRRRIETRKPAAYLTGEAWFAGIRFAIDERVLVPRSPLAESIERGFEPWLDPDRVRRVLDIGTGSGCIAIACAYAFPDAQIDASDISADALEVAARNVRDHDLERRVHLHRAGGFGTLTQAYDLIVSNPPYVPRASYEALPEEYRHEPELGLVAGEDGLEVVDEILRGAPERLAPGGLLVVEVGEAASALSEKYPRLPFTWLDFTRGGDHVFALTREQIQP